jgi:hypothetical protein
MDVAELIEHWRDELLRGLGYLTSPLKFLIPPPASNGDSHDDPLTRLQALMAVRVALNVNDLVYNATMAAAQAVASKAASTEVASDLIESICQTVAGVDKEMAKAAEHLSAEQLYSLGWVRSADFGPTGIAAMNLQPMNLSVIDLERTDPRIIVASIDALPSGHPARRVFEDDGEFWKPSSSYSKGR